MKALLEAMLLYKHQLLYDTYYSYTITLIFGLIGMNPLPTTSYLFHSTTTDFLQG